MDNPYLDRPCPVAKALDLFSGKWKVLILYQLSFGGYRYNELKREIYGITNTVLSRCLRELQQDRLVLRKDYDENPPHTEYLLSEFGKTLLPVLHEIRCWADENMQDKQPENCYNLTAERECHYEQSDPIEYQSFPDQTVFGDC